MLVGTARVDKEVGRGVRRFPTPDRPPLVPGAGVLAGSVGNFVEWFDFTLYGFSAVVIAATFFPPDSASGGLLGTFAVYGVAFVARPLGAVFFGRIGDRMGRRAALSLSVVLMGVATAAIGLLPSWATAGFLAPVLLLVCRLVQGFSAGGEYTGALTFSAEHAPPRRRALWLSITAASTPLAVVGATATVIVFQQVAGPEFAAGGWRWPFVVGGLLALVGLVLRWGVAETPVFAEVAADPPAGSPVRRLVASHGRTMLVLLVYFAVLGVVTHMVLGYMPTYLGQAAGLTPTAALLVIMATTLLSALTSPLIGLLADRFGRKPLLVSGAVGAVVLLLPAYVLIGTRSIGAVVVAMIVLLGVVSLLGAGLVAVLEMLPADLRFTGTALPYNLAYAVFAGTAPLVGQYLVDVSGNLLAPAVYGTALALVALPVIVRGIPETRRADLRTGLRQ